MPGFSRNQAKIAKALVEDGKTAKELREELGLPLHEVEGDLAKLIKLKTVEKLGGYPTKYRAVDSVRRGIMGEKPTAAQVFRAHAIIEGQSKDKKALEDATTHLMGQMAKDNIVTVTNVQKDEVVKEEGVYTNLFEVDIASKRLEDMVYFVLTYGPSSIELEPMEEYVVDPSEAQGILMDVASVLHSYASTLVQKDLALRKYRENSKEVFIK
ncbi:helix-turn-helix domain-containing protein [archaeon]